MPDFEPPSPPRKTFSENLADRPRARYFTMFAILGFTVSPVALVLIFYNPTDPTAEVAAAASEIRLEAVIGAVLLALHFLCIFFAWIFYRDEGQKSDHPDEQRQR